MSDADLVILFVQLIARVFRVARSGGLRAVVGESVLAKHQLLILNRKRRPSNLRIWDRLIAAVCSLDYERIEYSLWIKPSRLVKVAIAFGCLRLMTTVASL